jgi:hypothetical protein
VKENVKKAIADHFALDPTSLHLTHPTFFSRIDSKTARTMHDEYWHVHVDKVCIIFHYIDVLIRSEKLKVINQTTSYILCVLFQVTYPGFHYTSLLYLTDHGIDFKGGEFIFVDDKLNR